MHPDRLRFALEQLRPNQWERFEQFASAFLASEFPDLRTIAGPGDRARDAILLRPGEDISVVLQYSVAHDFKAKIRATAAELSDTSPDAQLLIYATNQKLGPASDDLARELRAERNLFLDVRDQSWFVERFETDASKAAAAEALVDDIAAPILADRGLIERKAPAMTSAETRAACVHLALQWADDVREKGLTKLSFEALVRSVLRDTHAENRMSRTQVQDRVCELLAASDPDRVRVLIDGALTRLDRRAIRHWRDQDEYCLSREEQARLSTRLADMELAEVELLDSLKWETARTYEAYDRRPPGDVDKIAACVRTSVEKVLLRQGELFATAVAAGHTLGVSPPDLADAVRSAMDSAGVEPNAEDGELVEIIEATTKIVLEQPDEPVRTFFRSFSDAYTLFAFLRETPDVQSAVVKLFSGGEVWLDTSVVLPLLAETLVEDADQRRFTEILRAADEADLKLRITEGVLEELEVHTYNSLRCVQVGEEWHSRIPFLVSSFALTGAPMREFGSWMEQFRGTYNPAQDLAEFLNDEFNIVVGSLEDAANAAPIDLRGAVQEAWRDIHATRRIGELDDQTRARLIAHDVENYVGVLMRRTRADTTGVGHRVWWLTLDSPAFKMPKQINDRLQGKPIDSPLMSPDFMISYLSLGPLRSRLSAKAEASLPLSVPDLGPAEHLPRELLAEAEEVRETMLGRDDRVIRREVRDRFDRIRRRPGPEARGGVSRMQAELGERIQSEHE